jgi:hypothetical protein
LYGKYPKILILAVTARASTSSTQPPHQHLIQTTFPQNSLKDPLKDIIELNARGVFCVIKLPNDQTIAITYEIEKDLSTCNCNSFSFIYWHIYIFCGKKKRPNEQRSSVRTHIVLNYERFMHHYDCCTVAKHSQAIPNQK